MIEETVAAGEWDRVLLLAQRFVDEEPGNWLAWHYLGLGHAKARDRPKAIPAFEKALSLQESSSTRMNLGVALAMEDRIEEALPHFERATKGDPKSALAWKMLMKAQAELDRLDEAAVSLGHASRLLPEDVELRKFSAKLAEDLITSRQPPKALAHYERAEGLAARGRHAEAEKAYKAALKIAPGFAECHSELGQLARKRGDLARAEREYRAAIAGYRPEEVLPRADALNDLANLLVARKGGAKEATRLVREAISLGGARVLYLDTLARACDAEGDTRCAAESFRQMLDMEAALHPDVRAHAEKRLGELSP